MKYSSTQLAALLACCLLMLTHSVAGHDMLETHRQRQVQGGVEWYNWFTDQFCLLIWIVTVIVVYPVGAISTLIGFPDVYTDMYHGVVAGWFKLTMSGY